MLENGKISFKQLIILIVTSRIVMSLTYLPELNSPPENQDLWIVSLMSFPFLLLLSIPIYFLWKRYPNQTIIEYSQTITGRAGTLLGVLYVWFFIDLAAINILELSLFYTNVQMPETPNLFFVISLVAFSAYAVRNGIEVIVRFTEFVFPLMVVIIVGFFFLLGKEMDVGNLLPLMEKGFLPVLHGGIIASVRTYEIFALAMLLPYLNIPRKGKEVIFFASLLVTLLFLIIDLSVLLTFGAEHGREYLFAYYNAIRLIKIGQLIERIESIHLSISALGTLVKVSFFYYLAVLALAQVLKLKDYKPLIIPVGTLIVVLCLICGFDFVGFEVFTSYRIYAWYLSFFTLIIPTLLLLISILKKKGEPR